MNRLLTQSHWLLPLAALSCLGWAWHQVHWEAATILTAPPEEQVRWRFHHSPCREMVSYFTTYDLHSRPSLDKPFSEFKENLLMLHTCWPAFQEESKALQINIASGLIPADYTDNTQDQLSLVQHFYPTESIPAYGAESDPTSLFRRIADQLINGDNTAQIRALRYSCQSGTQADLIKTAISTEPASYSRGWYALQMLEHCRLNPQDRQRYMRQQWQKHPAAHAFLMLEWQRYHGALPSEFQASEQPVEQAIAHFLDDMSYKTIH